MNMFYIDREKGMDDNSVELTAWLCVLLVMM